MTPAQAMELTAHVAVISRDPVPSAQHLASLALALGERDWSWIAAGQNRQLPTVPRSGFAPTLRQAPAVGLLAGRHTAIEAAADADIVILLDDDVSLPKNWFDKMLVPFADPNVHVVGCRYLPDYEHMPPDWLVALWRECGDLRTLPELSLLDGPEVCRPHDPTMVWGLCFAARRKTLVELGGFHPDGYPWPLRRYRGDGETAVSQQAKLRGLTAVYQGETHVMHRVPAERMTPEYFERRAFLQGISDSFTDMRHEGGPAGGESRSRRNWFRSLRWRAERALLVRAPTAAGIKRLMRRAHFLGAEYHREEVRRDQGLLEWVLKADYFDPNLPDGWERYLAGQEALP